MPAVQVQTNLAPAEYADYAPSTPLGAYVRLFKFRYHLSYTTVFFGAVIYPGAPFSQLAGSLILLYLFFNVFLYGGIYALNDVADVESDRQHPSKRLRPLAAGEISRSAAVFFALVMITLGVSGATWAFGATMAWVFTIFLLINALYSTVARNVPGLDLAFNSLTHPLRFVMGAWLAGHVARPAHVAVIFLFAVGVASLRRSIEKGAPGWNARRTLRAYSQPQLAAVRWAALAFIVVACAGDGFGTWPFFAAVVPGYLLTVFAPVLSTRGGQLLSAYWTS
jgi:4-hydroxybenzoate polyprenyltransferase